jgi:pimeloyl-ACP methyl ester carboxylesterase
MQRGNPAQVPLVCLPGLTRATRDFAPVFEHVEDRTVLAFDFRGRGLSWRADPATYRPDVEMADTISFLDHLGISRFALLGTSRGGIVGMLMASTVKERIAGLMLNDIGPVIELDGLKRIMGYVGKSARFPNWDAAAHALAWSSFGFENMTHDDWLLAARMIYAEIEGAPQTDHDPRLATNFPSIEKLQAKGVPEMWGLVAGLANMPLALLRGARSDLLSRQTVADFVQRSPELVVTEIPDRGHVPFLNEPSARRAINAWLKSVDACT